MRLEDLSLRPQPHLRDLLATADPARVRRLEFEGAGLRLDATHQAVTHEVLDALLELARVSQVDACAGAQRRGDPINATEGRPALHAALRGVDMSDPPWGQAIAQAVKGELDRFLDAAERLRKGQWRGHRGQRITDVVNLGIGGSDLGPRMAVEALAAQGHADVRVHFVSNLDAWELHRTLQPLAPDRTVFIVQSKSFTTQETMTLAASARRWLTDHGLVTHDEQSPHLIAVTARAELAVDQGYSPERIFGLWDWVGGRYSVWSAIGLPLAVSIGATEFKAFLAGGHAMDRHFWEAPPERNLPLWLALVGIWNRNFLGCPTHLMAVYASRLGGFARFLQQLDMESNGKSVHVDGSPTQIATGPIVWGGLGIDAQHSYFQLLHQGHHRVPVDFVAVEHDDTPLPLAAEHHRLVLLNLRAQARALALGRDAEATADALRAAGLDDAQVRALTPHRTFAGNVPSNVLWLPRLDAYHLGALIAAYEHKVFCQSIIWDINAFDQWGVELGKSMAKAMDNAPLP